LVSPKIKVFIGSGVGFAQNHNRENLGRFGAPGTGSPQM
jgi:hypothetical protein